MLVLTRKPEEKIVIEAPDGVRIIVHVAEIRGAIVRLGVTAPVSYGINRGEVQNRIDSEKRAA